MCGIAGFIDFRKVTNKETLVNMTDCLAHRGPDDSGYEFFETQDAFIGLGHKRLSILDLTKHGHQPMQYNNLVITYNGEIYNYKSIRKKLEAKGFAFVSNSDTEVILKAFVEKGFESLQDMIGMFAFVIFDKNKNKVYLCRDRVGVKPLYYYYHNDLFLFGSELKALFKHPNFPKTIDYDSVGLYLQHGYIPTPHSIFHNAYKLEPGTVLEFDLTHKTHKKNNYWDLYTFYNKPKLHIGSSEAVSEIDSLLIDSCKLRTIADVPIGVFLSGGYDSSLIAAILQKHSSLQTKTYTIGFEEEQFNEAHHAKRIAQYLNTDHKEFIVNYKDVQDVIKIFPRMYDEPFSDTSGILVSMISKLASSEVKVILTGDGAEEVFAGYENYLPDKKEYSFFENQPELIKQIINIISGIIITHLQNDNGQLLQKLMTLKNLLGYKYGKRFFERKMKNDYLNYFYNIKPNYFFTSYQLHGNNNIYDKMLAVDFKTRLLDDFLTKIDRATMFHGIEAREPMLDHRLIEFTATLPSNLKCFNNTTKYLLKQISAKYLPADIMQRPKMGFALPLHQWFKTDLKELFLDVLNQDTLSETNIFNIKNVIALRNKYLKSELNYKDNKKIVSIFLFEQWRKYWL